jgi:hypothetical protein
MAMMSKIEPMDTPKTRAEFELRFHHLREAIKSGKMANVPSDMVESLNSLRLLPNGRLDFLSVDEMARSHANTIFVMIQHIEGNPPCETAVANGGLG